MTSTPPPPPPPAPLGPAWGQPWAPAPAWMPAPQPPQAPGAGAALVLGIVALAGGFVLMLPLVVAPVAWYLGASAQRLAEREPERWRAGSARAGMILGIIGTAFLAVATLVAIVFSTLAWVAVATPSPY